MTRLATIPLLLLAAGSLAACGGDKTPQPAAGTAGGEMTDEEAQELARRHPIATPEPRPDLPEQSPPPLGRGEPPPLPPATDRGTPPPLPPAQDAGAPTTLAPGDQPVAVKSEALFVEAPPPSPPLVDRPPQPHYEYVWAPGYWYWYGGHHVWVSGVWLPPRRGYRYVGAHWVYSPRGWVFVAGGWALLGAASVSIVHWPVHHHGHWYSHHARHYDYYGYPRRNARSDRHRSTRRRGEHGVRRAPRGSRASGAVDGRSRRPAVRVRKRRRFR